MTPSLLVVDDQESILLFLENTLQTEGFRVRCASTGEAALAAAAEDIPDLVLLDLMLPDRSGLEVLASLRERFPQVCVVMMTAYREADTAVRAMKLGAFDYVQKPIRLQQLLVVIRKGLEATRAGRELQLLRRQADLFRDEPDIVPSQAPAMLALYETVRKVAAGHGTTILIEGESGVGKDVVAHLIHRHSPRSEFPFLEVNCASLPEQLLESELFGHERGAFTDAVQQKLGLLELAHRGTLFLHEIGEMGLAVQVKLLRVLEKMSFRRVGGLSDISVDVRVLAATNRDLDSLVASGGFRQDLYFRLEVVKLRIPPLRDRREDIPLLAEHFLGHFAEQFHRRFRGISPAALDLLAAAPWPGNIRELRNVLERAVLLEDGDLLEPEHLRIGRQDAGDDGLLEEIRRALADPLPDDGLPLAELLGRLEERLVRRAMDEAQGNQSRAARLLRLNRDRLRYRLKNLERDTG